jgi:hypothetical protein
MRLRGTITLFTEEPQSSRGLSPFAVSALAHAALLFLLSFFVIHAQRIEDHVLDLRYRVRHLELHTVESRMRPAGKGLSGSAPQPDPPAIPAPENPDPRTLDRQNIEQLALALQTLLQPDIPSKAILAQQPPLPTVLLWSPGVPPLTTVVPPSPHQPTAAEVRPSPQAPNEELDLADLAVSSGIHGKSALLRPGSTSPVVLARPELLQMPPVTTSESTAQPTPTAVVSLSELRMHEGTVTLPMANGAPHVSAPETLGLAHPAALSSVQSNPTAHPIGANGAPQAVADPAVATVGQSGSGAASIQKGAMDSDLAREPGFHRVSLPRDGHFGVVVVGSSLQEEFPEIVDLWGGRLTYSVYLHLGMAKNWILQYAMPRSAEAAVAGSAAPPEAPWPYTMVRPDLAAAATDAGTLMVHGFVDRAGHFEGLVLVFPPHPPKSEALVYALRQWEFRPATQNGQATAVEVLLIIPDESE